MHVTETRRSHLIGIVSWIIGEAKKGTHSIGFIPSTHYNTYHQTGQLAVCIDQEELLAFIVFGHTPPTARVWQIWTRNDARRELAATALIEWLKVEALKRGCGEVRARVKQSLDANLFWQAAGFHIDATVRSSGKRQQMINVWKWCNPQLTWLPGFEPAQALPLVNASNMSQRIQQARERVADKAEQLIQEVLARSQFHAE